MTINVNVSIHCMTQDQWIRYFHHVVKKQHKGMKFCHYDILTSGSSTIHRTSVTFLYPSARSIEIVTTTFSAPRWNNHSLCLSGVQYHRNALHKSSAIFPAMSIVYSGKYSFGKVPLRIVTGCIREYSHGAVFSVGFDISRLYVPGGRRSITRARLRAR
jgi:hypothetical protein